MPRPTILSPSPQYMEAAEAAEAIDLDMDTPPDAKPAPIWPNGMVVSWKEDLDSQIVFVGVLCPYRDCNTIEEQILPLETADSGPATRELRRCQKKDYPYSIVFPYDKQHPATTGLGWERNRTSQRYQVVGLKMPEFVASELRDISVVGPKRGNTDEEPVSLSKDVPWNVKNEPTDSCGNTSLANASGQGNIKTMKACLRQGADPESSNREGITPLMQAAVGGWVDAVILLLEFGASKETRNNAGLAAREMLEKPILNHDPFKFGIIADIMVLLSPDNYLPRAKYDQSLSSVEIGLLETVHDAQKSKGQTALQGTITLQHPQPVAVIKTAKVIKKTFASLHRGAPYQIIHACSGWTERAKDPNEFLNRDEWTKVVWNLAKKWNFDLPVHGHDNSRHQLNSPGTCFASHAEKKLVAYAVYKHPWHPRRMVPVFIITVDKPPCQSCLNFAEMAERQTGLKFKIVITKKRLVLPDPQIKALPKVSTRNQPFRKVNRDQPSPGDPQPLDEVLAELELIAPSLTRHRQRPSPKTPGRQLPTQTLGQALLTPPSSAESDYASSRFPEMEPESPSATPSRKRRVYEGNGVFVTPNSSFQKRTKLVIDSLPTFQVEINPITPSGHYFITQQLPATNDISPRSTTPGLCTRAATAKIPGNTSMLPIEILSNDEEEQIYESRTRTAARARYLSAGNSEVS